MVATQIPRSARVAIVVKVDIGVSHSRQKRGMNIPRIYANLTLGDALNYIYTDGLHRITFINGSWISFADSNGTVWQAPLDWFQSLTREQCRVYRGKAANLMFILFSGMESHHRVKFDKLVQTIWMNQVEEAIPDYMWAER